ncbi:MAG: sugar ABC transporter permease [Actinomycetia bacterium]|nr:sugar ABC transporter permease [Actinomycetes bacterium]
MNIKRKKLKINESFTLLYPFLLFYLVFMIIPIFWTFYLAFQKGGFISGFEYVGIDNFINAWKDQIFIKTIRNTGYYVILVIPSVMGFSLFMAILINKMKRFQNFVKACIFLPLVSSVVPLAKAWQQIFMAGEEGLFNYFLNLLFRIPPQNWLSSSKLIIPAIAIFEFWRGFGFWTIIFLGGLSSISKTYYEAAEIDGASTWRQLLYITVPLLRPTFIFLTIMGLVWNFQLFDVIYVLTFGGPAYSSYTMVFYTYSNAFLYEKVGMAATMGIILMGIILILTILSRRVLERKE